jgi:cohesin complex subunit SA-1/2
MASYVQQERKATRKDSKGRYADKRAQVLTIFKCLILLLGPVNGRGALKIKSEMESGLRDANVEVTGHKMWEGYRAFEKRLVLIASKDDNIRAGAARVMEQEQEQEQDQEQEGTERSVSPTPGPTANLVADDEEEEEDAGPDIDMDEQPDEELDFDLGDLDDEPQTPGTKRSRSIAVGSVRPTKKAKK